MNSITHSGKRGSQLTAAQENAGHSALKIVREIKTRWNSRFDMLVRLIKLAPAIDAMDSAGDDKELTATDLRVMKDVS